MSEGFGLGRFSGRQLAILWAILSAGLLLRILALDWGLPPSGDDRAAAGLHDSYALDEGPALDALARSGEAAVPPGGGGTLHRNLTLVTLELAGAAGVFGEPWREAWRGMHPGAFERVYVVGRLLSVAIDLIAVLLTALLALRLGGRTMALWTAALAAAAPGHVLQAGVAHGEVATAACLVLLCLVIVDDKGPFATGLIAGLTAAAKFLLFPPVVAAIAVDAVYRGRQSRRLAILAAGAGLGFLAGDPWIVSGRGLPAAPGVLWTAPSLGPLLDFARFSVGLPTALLAAAGFVLLWRRGGVDGRLLPVVFAVGLLASLPQPSPLLRDLLPLAAPATVAAAGAIISMERWGKPLGALAAFVAASASYSVVSYRLSPHPANLALQVLERVAEPGDSISRMAPGLPPLDPNTYPEGPDPHDPAFAAAPPDWAVVARAHGDSYPPATEELLAERYERTAVFRNRSRSSWATLGEHGAPRDWKSSHPRMTIYRKR